MKKLFKKKEKNVNLEYTSTSKVGCVISIIYMDNYKEIMQLSRFNNTKAKSLCYMMIKMDIDTSAITDLNEYKWLFDAIKYTDYYTDENGSLIIMGSINRIQNLADSYLKEICEDEDIESCTLCHQLKEFLDKVFDEEGKYDEVYRPTNHISLSTLNEPTERTCEVINEFTYDYPKQKTCMLLRIDGKVISWIKNITYSIYDHDFFWIKEIEIDDYRSFIVIEDIEYVANLLEPHYLYNINDDTFEERFKQLSSTEQKVYQYFMDFLRKYRTTSDTLNDDEDHEEVDFSDIDEVIE